MGPAAQRAQPVHPRDVGGDEGEVAGAAPGSVERLDRGVAERPAHRVELGEHRPARLGQRHRGVAVVEADLRRGSRQALRDDGAHPGPGPFLLLLGGEAEVAADHGGGRDDVGLARHLEGVARGVRDEIGAAGDDAGVVGEPVLPGDRVAEHGEDPRRLVDRAVAGPAEHAGRVGLPGLDLEEPAAGTPTADAGVLATAALEGERHVGALRRVDQVAPGDLQRTPGGLLVAGDDDGDIHPVELARGGEGLEREEEDDVSPLHVAGPRSPRDRIGPDELLPLPLEHGVEMSDEEEALPAGRRAAGRTLRDQVAAAAHLRRHVHPLRGEAEPVELGPEDGARRAYSGDIECPALLVDQPLEDPDLLLSMRRNPIADPDFRSGERRRWGLASGQLVVGSGQ